MAREHPPRTLGLPQTSSPLDSSDPAPSSKSATSAIHAHVDGPNEELRKIFDQFDENKDGQISKEEMSRSFQRLGFCVPPDELATMMGSIDLDGDGFVNYSEFISMYGSLMKGKDDHEGDTDDDAELKKAFQVFDKDGDGFISAEELYSVLSSMGVLQGRTLQDCVNMIRKVDTDGNGHVEFEEFKQMMAPRVD